MKIDKMTRINSKEKQFMINCYRNLKDSDRILVIDGISPHENVEYYIENAIDLYSRKHLYLAVITNSVFEGKSMGYIVERYARPSEMDMVVIKTPDGFYTEWYRKLTDDELNSIFGIVLEESLDFREN